MTIRSALGLSRSTWPAFAVMGTLWGAFAAAIPEIKAALGAGDAAFGLALFGSPAGLIAALWLAPWIDRRLGALGLPAAACGLALAFAVPAFMGGLWSFAIAMGFVGLASGALDVLTNSRISEAEERHGRSLMNINHAMFSAFYTVAAVATGIAREAGAAPAAILVVLAIACLALASLTRTVPETVAPGTEAAGFPRGIVAVGGIALAFAFFCENATEAWSALHLERTLGGRAAEGALGPALLGLTMFAGRLGGQVVSGRLDPVAMVVGAALLGAGGAALAALAPTILVAYLGFAALGLGISVLAPMLLSLIGKRVAPDRRTAAIARVSVIGFMGFVVAPPLMGLVSGAVSLRASFGTLALVMLVLIPLVRALGRPR